MLGAEGFLPGFLLCWDSGITEPWILLLERSMNGHVSILFDSEDIEDLRGGVSLWCLEATGVHTLDRNPVLPLVYPPLES